VTALPEPETFLSGESEVGGARLPVTRALGDRAFDLLGALAGTARRLDGLAAAQRPRRVLVLSIYRPDSVLPEQMQALRSRSHQVTFALGATGRVDPALAEVTLAKDLSGGKFENLNRVLRELPDRPRFDWTLVIDDDVRLPARFLDRFTAVCERFRLDLAQPAQTLRSHAAWRVTLRRPASLVRQTRFVEIGPVTGFGREAAAELMPFPELRYGWGLDLHWAALAEKRGWRLGVVDALPVRHEAAPVGAAYGHDEAIAEAARFLSGRPYLPSIAARQTLATHRRLAR
jgi:hypothetical protein